MTLRPVRGQLLTDTMGLSLLSCTNACTLGETSCKTGGVATCQQQQDSCLGWGPVVACAADTPLCSDGACIASPGTVRPSNSDVIGDLEDTGRIVDVPVDSVFDTSTSCTTGSILGRCAPVMQAPLAEICVCRAESVTIHGLTVQGGRSLAILAWKNVAITGPVIVQPGAGARAKGMGDSEGASYGSRGGGSQIAPSGDPSIVPLVGGFSAAGLSGGRGGGAVQITANDEIRIDGILSAGGEGGTRAGCASDLYAAGGGGSGGSILLESTSITGTGTVIANGGGGSAGYTSYRPSGGTRHYTCGAVGENGRPDLATAAAGGVGAFACTTYYGGTGGVGSIGDGDGAVGEAGTGGSCSNGSAISGPGGGGGGAGRIRINTAAGTCASCLGGGSPSPTYGTTRYLP